MLTPEYAVTWTLIERASCGLAHRSNPFWSHVRDLDLTDAAEAQRPCIQG